jgi:dimethylaniline monooxygenase (N-oxide forming)
LYQQLAYGVGTPHLYRFFETGKRKAWPRALDAIKEANRESAKDIKDSVRDWKATKAA